MLSYENTTHHEGRKKNNLLRRVGVDDYLFQPTTLQFKI